MSLAVVLGGIAVLCGLYVVARAKRLDTGAGPFATLLGGGLTLAAGTALAPVVGVTTAVGGVAGGVAAVATRLTA